MEVFIAARRDLRTYGLDRLREELGDLIDGKGEVSVAANPFATAAAGVLAQTDSEKGEASRRQAALGKWGKYFVVVNNHTRSRQTNEADLTYKLVSTSDDTIKGRSGMSFRHEFLIPKKRDWQFFNVLTLGLVDDGISVAEAIEMLEDMREAALYYTRNAGRYGLNDYTNDIGLFFHCYPNVGVQFLHMHIIDMAVVGPSFQENAAKHISIEVVLSALRAEEERVRKARVEAATTKEFQNILRNMDTRMQLFYSRQYLGDLPPEQKDRLRRNRLYTLGTSPSRRAKIPQERLGERLKKTRSEKRLC
jgi:hypothetical protein